MKQEAFPYWRWVIMDGAFTPYAVGERNFGTNYTRPPTDGLSYYTYEEMNYNRKAWERKHPRKRNPIARELSEDKYKPKIVPPKRERINPRDIESLLNEDDDS